MSKEEFLSAILLLESLDRQQQDVQLAMESFTHCHAVSLRLGDVNGFFWSVQILQTIIRRSVTTQDETSENLFNILLESFGSEQEEEESSVALAAFHVAKRATVTKSSPEEIQLWYIKCLGESRTGYLRYLAAEGMGKILHLRGAKDEALPYFKAAMDISRNHWVESFAIASFRAAQVYAQLGQDSEAMQTMVAIPETLGTSVSRFLSILCFAVNADMVRQKNPTPEEVIKAYTNARVGLASLMPDLYKKFVEYCEITCFSSELLLKFLTMDEYSKYFVYRASEFDFKEVEAPIQVERSFFLFELYTTCRKEVVKIQQELPIASYMDPRPHLEEGTHMFITKTESNEDALDQLVFCQQVAVKTGHTSCMFLVWVALNNFIQIENEAGNVNVETQLFECFRSKVTDGEDPKAWALFYVGKSGLKMSRIPERHYDMLKEALRLSRTPLLGFHATEVLGSFSIIPLISMEVRLQYSEKNKAYAYLIGKEEFIISALQTEFEVAVMGCWMFDRAENIRTELFQLQLPIGSIGSRLSLAIALFMEGFLRLHMLCLGRQTEEFFQKAVTLLGNLPLYPPLAYEHTYLASAQDAWTIEHNMLAQLTYNNAQRFGGGRQFVSFGQTMDRLISRREQYYNSVAQVQSLAFQGKLDGAEENAAELLQVLKDGGDDMNPAIRAELNLALAQVAASRYQSVGNGGAVLSDTLDTIRHFMRESEAAAQAAATLVPFKGFTRWIHASYAIILHKLGERGAAIVEIEKMVLEGCINLDPNFGDFSYARYTTLQGLRAFFNNLQELLWQSGELNRCLVWEERERARDLLYSMKFVEDRERYLKDLNDFDTDYDKAWKDIRSVGTMLGPDTVLLIISHRKTMENQDVLFTYFLHPELEVVGHKHEQFSSVAELQKSILAGTSTYTSELLAEYHNILMRPFEVHFEQTQPKRIIFVPSGDMCMVPFPALIDESRPEKPYLIQRYATATISSLRSLKQCLLRAMDLSIQQTNSLVVGNPTLDLNYSEEEIAIVGGILKLAEFKQVKALLGENATKQALLDLLPLSNWVHIACHGDFNLDKFPLGSLQLSSPNGTHEEENLIGLEIQKLEAPLQARCVVLSACKSGLGVIYSEGILALPRFFHLTGVPSVIVSLWKVDDGDTNVLMEKMYANMLNGLELEEALQCAMVEMIETNDVEFGSVYGIQSWAAFIISGSPFAKLVLS